MKNLQFRSSKVESFYGFVLLLVIDKPGKTSYDIEIQFPKNTKHQKRSRKFEKSIFFTKRGLLFRELFALRRNVLIEPPRGKIKSTVSKVTVSKVVTEINFFASFFKYRIFRGKRSQEKYFQRL